MKNVQQFITPALALFLFAAPVAAQSGKVAIVDTSAFMHPRKGITRLVKALASVDREFEDEISELARLHQRMEKETEKFSFAGPIPTDPEPMTPERRREAQANVEMLRKAIKLHEEGMQLAHSRRAKEAAVPILQDIRRNLEAFAKSRGITVLLDAGQTACLVGCDGEFTAALDVTQEFIAEYNRLHP